MATLYYNGIIRTADDRLPEAGAVLEKDGLIEKVYPVGAKLPGKGEENIVWYDLKGNTLVPGFIDGHSHFFQNARLGKTLNAYVSPRGKADSVEELIDSLKEQLKDPKYADEKILFAQGYDEAGYADHRIPTRFDLDEITDRPLAVTHISGHNTIFNSAALELAGIDDSFEPGEGGSVGRFADKRLTGVFYERAVDAVLPKLRALEGDVLREGIDDAVRSYASVGITTAQDGGTKPKDVAAFRALAADGKLPFDVLSYVLGDGYREAIGDKSPEELATSYKDHYRVAGLKLFLDGSPQAKTAWLSKPYHVIPEGLSDDYNGYGTKTDEELYELVKEAVESGWQINVHTNGDEAIEQLIRIYSKVLEEVGNKKDLRPVSIHCQTVRDDQLKRMKKLGIIASFFVDHVYYWGDYHSSSVLGPERARRISPLASALDLGINFSIHQDTPVTVQNPIFAIHNAVNRKTRNGELLGPEFRITPWQALKAVTLHTAYQIFEENEKGSITEGKKADFAVLSADPLTVVPDSIKDIKVEATIKGGDVIFARNGGDGKQ